MTEKIFGFIVTREIGEERNLQMRRGKMARVAAAFSTKFPPDPGLRRQRIEKAVRRYPEDLVLAENFDCAGDGYWTTVYGPEVLLLDLMSKIGVERGAGSRLGTDLGVCCLSVTGTLISVRRLVEEALAAVPA